MFKRGKCVCLSSLFAILLTVGVQKSDLTVAQATALDSIRSTMSTAARDASTTGKLHPALLRRLAEENAPVKAWVFFTDKGLATGELRAAALRQVAAAYSPRATQRRLMRAQNAARGGALFDEHDLPVATGYTDAVVAMGARLHITSRWLNAVSVWATRDQLERIAELPFVDRLEAVARTRPVHALNVTDMGPGPFPAEQGERTVDYGAATVQLTQINLIALHNAGFTASGVVVGILDSGFHRAHEAFNNPLHPLSIVAEYDFVNNDGNTDIQPGDYPGQADHGTMILGCLAAYKPGSLVGGAYNASFILCKTEDISQEVPAEEDNYVAGLEFIEANGADMTTSSLGYIDWYTQDQLDGQTAVTTIAINISTANGVHHCNAAGNEYHDSDPGVAHLIAPADAFQCLTCGAVDSTGAIASFSSDGPTADGRVKPEVLARGISTHTVSPSVNNGYTTADGTSLSTPLVACAVACLIQARPYWTVDDMRTHLFETADYYVTHNTFDPLYVRGYGIINAFAAFHTCADAGTVTLDRNKYACAGTAHIVVNDCGLNTDNNMTETVQISITSTSELAGELVVLTETEPDAGEFEGSITLSMSDAPGLLWVAPGDTITATYVDANNGQGQPVTVTATAIVDCVGPVISNVQAIDIQPRGATITFTSNEPARGIVHYGLSCETLNQTATGALSASPSVAIGGLLINQTYYFKVDAIDEAENATSDPTCYSFTTPEVPDFFTQLFATDNDLDFLSLSFVPNGSVDFYHGCTATITALPTDPTGGTALPLTDDSNVQVNLTGGATVALYGVAYNHFWVGSNGYLTFNTGDTGYDEDLAAHFDQPRISALYDDLDPGQAGTVSWRQLADRVAVTWLNVTLHNGSNQNTFQIEMYFDGRITISYLAIAVSDGLAGLSRGTGEPPDFIMSDLSALGPCIPTPPTANNDNVSTNESTPTAIALRAQDDGQPIPPAALMYVVETLPVHGSLADAGAGAITAAPYALIGGGHVVIYTPRTHYVGADSFMFKANDGGTPPEGGDSNSATIMVTVIAVPEQVLSFPLDTNPGWTTQGQWAFGHPTGVGTHNNDPGSAHTGADVYGYNLDGDYTDNMPKYSLTTTALDLHTVTGAQLRFWRWLGVERFDRATVEVSNDGTNWTTIWTNPTEAPIADLAWLQRTYDISAVADGHATVYIRWGMGPTEETITYPGWNIDDIEIWGIVPAPSVTGDMNCDAVVNFADINPFVLALTGQAPYEAAFPNCRWLNADVNGDGLVSFADINPFVALLTGGK